MNVACVLPSDRGAKLSWVVTDYMYEMFGVDRTETTQPFDGSDKRKAPRGNVISFGVGSGPKSKVQILPGFEVLLSFNIAQPPYQGKEPNTELQDNYSAQDTCPWLVIVVSIAPSNPRIRKMLPCRIPGATRLLEWSCRVQFPSV